jgi:hypothetical protein
MCASRRRGARLFELEYAPLKIENCVSEVIDNGHTIHERTDYFDQLSLVCALLDLDQVVNFV